MTVDELNELVKQDIQATKDYSEFMQEQSEPMLTTVGKSHMEHLHFFNLGYKYAMEKIQSLINDSQSDTIEFDKLPKLPECGHKLKLIPVPNEPRTYKVVCPECDTGTMELID